MRFDQSKNTSYLRDYCPVGRPPEGLEMQVTLRGRINEKGNFVCVTGPLRDDTYNLGLHYHTIAIPWRSLFALPREQVLVNDEGPPNNSIRMDSSGLLWMRQGDYWHLLTPGRGGSSPITWTELQSSRGPMKPVPEVIGGAR